MISAGPEAYPRRNPGAKILEKLSRRTTRSSRSRDCRVGNGIPVFKLDQLIGVVFQDQKIIARGNLQQVPAAFQGENDAGRVVAVGNIIDEFRQAFAFGRFSLASIRSSSAVTIPCASRGMGIKRSVNARKAAMRAGVSRFRQGDAVLFIEEEIGHGMKAFLCAVENLDLLSL